MFNQVSEKYNFENWNYLNISDEIINVRYDWVNIALSNGNEKYPWAHEYDMTRLFMLSVTFSNKEETVEWIESNLDLDLMPIHHSLLNMFCYSDCTDSVDIDSLINNAEDIHLLLFIQQALERSIQWYNPEPCWPGDITCILKETSRNLEKGFDSDWNWVNKPEIEGVDLVSLDNHIHVFYKFQNLISGLVKGELYYDIKDLSRQAHELLLIYKELFFAEKSSSLSEAKWEMKLNEVGLKETEWCKAVLKVERNK